MRVRGFLGAALLAVVTAVAPIVHADEIAADPDLRARVLSFGPWPPAPVADASNRVESDPRAVALGRRLFGDARLSRDGKLACASCHDPRRAFQDGRRFARHRRNTPSLLDAGQRRWFGWDGAKDSLWAASLAPLTASDEIGATAARVVALLGRDADLGRRYAAIFGPPRADASVLVDVAKALAAYQATLVSPRTPFDDYRDALERGDAAAAARYPADARRGLAIFAGKGNCFFCHTGPAFTNEEFGDVGRPFFTPGGVDPGRWGGLQQLLASSYTRLGKHADAGPDDPRAVATRHVVMEPRNFGEFKVPGLRGLVATAPYFHDGSAATLEDVVRHYSMIDERRLHVDGTRVLQPLDLTKREIADLVAFLRSLSPTARRD
jgi:cytochrome c peroxidase